MKFSSRYRASILTELHRIRWNRLSAMAEFSVLHLLHRTLEWAPFSNPIARWHICQSSINGIAFSIDGAYLATVGRDGYLWVFDYQKEQLICGGKILLWCSFMLCLEYGWKINPDRW